jgi:thiol-disulfide isomerase/thioredoxin
MIIDRKAIIILLTLVLLTYSSKGTPQYLEVQKFPEIGKPCPDFVLSNIEHYTQTQATLKDFKGKWLVLDFWSNGCSGCFQSFPKMDLIQKEYRESLQMFFVGIYNDNLSGCKLSDTKATYKKHYEKGSMKTPCAFDSEIYKNYGVKAVPYIIVIDPKGIVRGITYTLSSDDVREFIAGKQPVLNRNFRAGTDPSINYNYNLPLGLQGRESDTSFLYRSLLTKWDISTPVSFPEEIGLNEFGRFEALKTDANYLYMYAYIGKYKIRSGDSLYGKVWGTPIIEAAVRDVFNSDWNNLTGRNVYSFSLTVPNDKATKRFLMNVLQRELLNYFGYTATIEVRKMPYWKLIVSDSTRSKLKTKGGPFYSKNTATGFEERNIKTQFLLDEIAYFHPNEPPLLDETAISTNIDITLDCLATNFDDIKTALALQGLQLVKSERDMHVLVIRDDK